MARTGLSGRLHVLHVNRAAVFVEAPGYMDLLAFIFLRSPLVVELVRDIVRGPKHILSPDFMIVPANVCVASCFCMSPCCPEAGC